MGISPVAAQFQKALKLARFNQNQIDLFNELNEAFASQSLAVIRELEEFKPEIINVNG